MTFLSFFAQVDAIPQNANQLPMPALVLILLLPFLCFGLALAIVIARVKRCPSNKLLVVYTKTAKNDKVISVTNQSRFILPVLQDYAWLSLDPIEKEFLLNKVESADGKQVNLNVTFKMAVGTSEELMQNAGRWIAGLESNEVLQLVEEVVVQRSSQFISSLPYEQVKQDREKLGTSICESLESDLARIGLVPLELNITSTS